MFLLFRTDEISQALVKCCGFAAKTSGCGQHKRGEDTMLDLTHTFPILSFLSLFVTTEGSLEIHGAVA